MRLLSRTVFALIAALATLAACKDTSPSTASGAASNQAASAPAGQTPPDGKYENVTVEGRVVPMIHVMNGGEVVLVDTDGKKPRDWEEQFKRKGSAPRGTYNLHKMDVNHSGAFDDDPIDREGSWTIDDKGNVTPR